jgi:hypothetical protein
MLSKEDAVFSAAVGISCFLYKKACRGLASSANHTLQFGDIINHLLAHACA